MKKVNYYCDYCSSEIESTLTMHNIKLRKNKKNFGSSTSSLDICNNCPPEELIDFMDKFSLGVRLTEDNQIRFLFNHTTGPSNEVIPENTEGYDIVYKYIDELVDKYYE